MNLQLIREIRQMPVIDTHEHMMHEKVYAGGKYDFFSLLQPYVCDILTSAGMTPEEWHYLSDTNREFTLRWERFQPWLDEIRFTTYFQAVLRGLKDLYGVDRVTDRNCHFSIFSVSR